MEQSGARGAIHYHPPLLALALRGQLAESQPILFLDASWVHVHPVAHNLCLAPIPQIVFGYLLCENKMRSRAGPTVSNSSRPPQK